MATAIATAVATLPVGSASTPPVFRARGLTKTYRMGDVERG
jgi:hypothetical protein